MAKKYSDMSQEEREKERDEYMKNQKPPEPEEPAELVYEPNPEGSAPVVNRPAAKKRSR